MNAMRFVLAFLAHVEEQGIFDEYDPDENCMVTSDEMLNLIDMAKEIAPERLAADEAATTMRALTDAERDAFIRADEENVVVDMRSHFVQEMSANNGARGVLEQLVMAQERGDLVETKRLLTLAKEFTEQ
jgi:hypothetical protein